MDEDENLSMLLSMGFPDIEEAQRALRAAKNDLNEAVSSKDHVVLWRQTIAPCNYALTSLHCKLAIIIVNLLI